MALVNVADAGIPKAGVINVGLLFSTKSPVPLATVVPVPPLEIGRVPIAVANCDSVAAVKSEVPLPYATPLSVLTPVHHAQH